mmetsp:Transcript_43852/g.77048  ORF Transcript_43852/g.77048 Transcript_43852/m.77048 type:complete len:264 (-) Transcript_43852:898-1689(-)
MPKAFERRDSSSREFFLLASVRNFVALVTCLPSFASKLAMSFSSFVISPLKKTLSSSSTWSDFMPSTFSFADVMLACETFAISSASSAALIISSAFRVLAWPGSGPTCFSTLVTSSLAVSTASAAFLMFASNSSFSLANSRSRASLFSFRFASKAFSRAKPTADFSLWKSSFFTPLPSATKALQIVSIESCGIVNLYSPFENFCISLLDMTPSLVAYLENTDMILSNSSSASACRSRNSFCWFAALVTLTISFFLSLKVNVSF